MWFTLVFTVLVCLANYHAGAFEIICEGNQAEMSFHYAQSNVSITLQYSNRYPFYSDGKMLEAGLSGDQIKRFQVEEIHGDGLLVVVKIVNVSRQDAGTYIAFAGEDKASEESSMRRESLVVEYPPAKPVCRFDLSFNIDIISDVWETIECTAEIGNIPGYIVCFQDDQAVPPQNRLTQGKLTLSQKIWVKKDQGFLCCSSGYKDPFIKTTRCTEFHSLKERETTPFYETSTWSINSDIDVSSSDKIMLGTTEIHETVETNKYNSHTSLCSSLHEMHGIVLLYIVLCGMLIGFISVINLNFLRRRENLKILKDIKIINALLISQSPNPLKNKKKRRNSSGFNTFTNEISTV